MSASRSNLRYLAIFGLVAGQVVPNVFILFALPAIYRTKGIDLADLGILSVAMVPFWFKWLWAPIVDRVGNRKIGFRKSWIIPCTTLGAAIYGVLTFIPPEPANIYLVAALLLLKNLVMATQDIAVDAYVVEALDRGEEATGATASSLGTVIGGVIGGSLLVGLYDLLGWQPVMLFAAAMLLVGSSAAIFLPERSQAPATVRDERRLRAVLAEIPRHLRSSASLAVLALVLLVQFAVALPFRIENVLLVDKGLSLAEIGFLGGGATTIGGILGMIAGERLGRILGLRAALFWGAVGSAAIAAMYVYIAATPLSAWDYAVLNLIAMVLGGPFYVALNATRFRWSSRHRVATDYTLQSSLTSLAQASASLAAALLADHLGWTAFYIVAGLLMTLSCFLLAAVFRRVTDAVDARDAQEGAPSSAGRAVLSTS